MIPKTLSATSLSTFNECPARWKVQYLDRIPDDGEKHAANLGTAVHAALEEFVGEGVPTGTPNDPNEINRLLQLYMKHFINLFGSTDNEDTVELFKDGLDMLKKWLARDPLWGIKFVVSCETKSTFPIKTSVGEIPFNYIWDRCDKMADEHIRVVDYKTQREGYGPDKIKRMIQPRIYALAAAIQFKGHVHQDIEVEMDLLRHEPVSAFFTRDDNIATYTWLQNMAESIIAESYDNPTFKLNRNCIYCPIKATCPRLRENVNKGGIFTVTPEEAPLRLAEAQYKIKALTSLADELSAIVLAQAEAEDLISWETGEYDVRITAQRRRTLDSERAAKIIGPALQSKYGKLRLGDVDHMIKAGEITEQQAKELKAIMGHTYGSPTVKVEPKIPFEEEM